MSRANTITIGGAILLIMAAMEGYSQRSYSGYDTPKYSAATGATSADRSANEQAVFERGRRAFIENDCYSCHGWYQTPHFRWGDLSKSALVGSDTSGNLLKPFVRHGIECRINLNRPMMPAFWDLSEEEMDDLVSYIHFERQDRRYREIVSDEDLTGGDSRKGQMFFAGSGQCAQCHSATGDLSGISKRTSRSKLRERLLRPIAEQSAANAAGLLAHRKRLENYTVPEVRDMLAYLATVK